MTDPIPWLTLTNISGLGPVAIATLLAHFKTPENILKASAQQLQTVLGIGKHLALAICRAQDTTWAEKQLTQAQAQNIGLITRSDPQYPQQLCQIFAPPPLLFYKGNLALCHAPTIAIVGSRSFTAYGREIAHTLARDLVRSGITVVSGMAVGIDTHAHKGALEHGGATAAVLGSSLDIPYPGQNRDLFHQICKQGVTISEFPLGTKPEAHNFPRRNRIISGLSLGTVVVEAGQRSGALITAQFALEQNRDVFAVPGPIYSGKSIGTHDLIQQGARLVKGVDDILNEIQMAMPRPLRTPPPQPALSDEEKSVWDALIPPNAHQLNDLARKTRHSSAQTLNILLSLELQGFVEQLPGLRFQRKA